ncbi:MAG: phage antirepressor N-terminal domain-containing protein [Bilophila wadsworthia]
MAITTNQAQFANRERWGDRIITTPSAWTTQDTLCMPVRKLPAFFASINPNKVRPELRDRIRLYQDECDDALWNYWTKGQATRRPKAALPAVPQPTRQEQTAAIAGTLPHLPAGVLQGRV